MKVQLAVLLAAACAVSAAACGSSDSGGTSKATASAQAPKAPPIPVVSGEPVVNATSYPLPDTTGYQTAVSFTVSNPTDQPIVNAKYRVTVKSAGGKTLATTDGTDTVSLPAGGETVVVATPDVEGTRPKSATVKLYEGEPAAGAVVPNPADWKTENATLKCDGLSVGCDVTADLTWTGTGSPSATQIDAVVRRTEGGKVVAAGQLSADGNFSPGRTAPVSGFVTGNETFRNNAPDSPIIELYPRINVYAGDTGGTVTGE